ncbi:hypothetical protein DPMN_164439 [Dreissena polymorpha]|uniref:Uncharacterized protein n=1 Tax=Dreissena polymorpha TaxID=45954 RepID=A0A9D4EYQ1_DREPO|nr:hypothetical protein DPMN_164439 [Dreissena polymorpha]
MIFATQSVSARQPDAPHTNKMVDPQFAQLPLPTFDPLEVIQTPAVLSSGSQNLLKGNPPYPSHNHCHLSHVCHRVSLLNTDTQVRRVSLHQQPIRRNPPDGRPLHFIETCSKAQNAEVASRECSGPT